MVSRFKVIPAFLFLLVSSACTAQDDDATQFDVVVVGARVVDPESGLDDVRNIGIKGKEIAAVTSDPISGTQVIDASGLIAAPGFIDLHAHGQDPYSEKISILDGRTTQLDLEAGALPVSVYYNRKAGTSLANYGVSVSHAGARLLLMDGIDPDGSPMLSHALDKAGATGNQWAANRATDEQLDEIDRLVAEGLSEGGIGIGVMVGYYPDARSDGVARMARLAAEHNSFLTTHPRYLSITAPSGVLGQQEFISLATSYDVPLLLHHVSTNALAGTATTLDMVHEANRNGAKILAEAFPYTKGSTFIATRILDPGWQERTDMSYDDLTWVLTGETLTEETFQRYRREQPGGFYIMEHIKEKDMMTAILDPDVVIASDGTPFADEDGNMLAFDAPDGIGLAHPRGAGTNATYLRLAIDDGSLTMLQILAKTSYLQAVFLEEFVPGMKKRARIQPGAFADITIFDPETVDGMAGFEPGTSSLPSKGVQHVLVNGQTVVRDGAIVNGVFPGEPVRSGSE